MNRSVNSFNHKVNYMAAQKQLLALKQQNGYLRQEIEHINYQKGVLESEHQHLQKQFISVTTNHGKSPSPVLQRDVQEKLVQLRMEASSYKKLVETLKEQVIEHKLKFHNLKSQNNSEELFQTCRKLEKENNALLTKNKKLLKMLYEEKQKGNDLKWKVQQFRVKNN